MARDHLRKAILAATALAAVCAAAPAAAQASAISIAEGVHAGEVAVPVNKSQVIRSDRPYAKALIGNPEIADVLPLTDQSLYVLGKKMGTTSLTLYDRGNTLIAVVDVVVGPDVIGLKRQLSELMSADTVGARISNDFVVLEGVVPDAVAADRAVQIAETYAPGKVVNLLSIGSAQQVMLEVRFSEIKRSALKEIGFSLFATGSGSHGFGGVIGNGASLTLGEPARSRRRYPVAGARPRDPGNPVCAGLDHRQLRHPAAHVQHPRAEHSTRRSTRLSARARSPRSPSRPWSRCRARPRASLPAANSRSRSFRTAARRRTAIRRSRSNGSRSASAWPSLRPCSPTASSTWSSRRKSARSIRPRRS